jgi:hypothetical protein
MPIDKLPIYQPKGAEPERRRDHTEIADNVVRQPQNLRNHPLHGCRKERIERTFKHQKERESRNE